MGPYVEGLTAWVEEREVAPGLCDYIGDFFRGRGLVRSLLVAIDFDDGRRGVGEATPLPGWSGETPESALLLIEDVLRPALLGRPAADVPGLARAALAGNGYLLWAVEAAVAAIDEAPPAASPVPIRGLVPPLPAEAAGELAASQTASGYKRLKVKLTGVVAEDAARLRSVRDAAPAATIVADANEAIAHEELDGYGSVFREAGLAAVEQPCPRETVLERGLPEPDGWLWIADESIWGVEDALALAAGPWQVWTVHPAKARGEAALRRVAEIAAESGVVLVVGSNLHFAAGVDGLARIAGTLPSSPEQERLGHDLPAPVVVRDWSHPLLAAEEGRLVPTAGT